MVIFYFLYFGVGQYTYMYYPIMYCFHYHLSSETKKGYFVLNFEVYNVADILSHLLLWVIYEEPMSMMLSLVPCWTLEQNRIDRRRVKGA